MVIYKLFINQQKKISKHGQVLSSLGIQAINNPLE